MDGFVRPDVRELIEGAGGTIKEVGGPLPDGSGFLTASFPLPKDHWSVINPDTYNEPSMPFRIGLDERVVVQGPDRTLRLSRNEFAELIREVGRYAYRCCTMNGKDTDIDPDALLQNLVVGFLGYWTKDGTSSLT
jgi:hypothetical protein